MLPQRIGPVRARRFSAGAESCGFSRATLPPRESTTKAWRRLPAAIRRRSVRAPCNLVGGIYTADPEKLSLRTHGFSNWIPHVRSASTHRTGNDDSGARVAERRGGTIEPGRGDRSASIELLGSLHQSSANRPVGQKWRLDVTCSTGFGIRCRRHPTSSRRNSWSMLHRTFDRTGKHRICRNSDCRVWFQRDSDFDAAG